MNLTVNLKNVFYLSLVALSTLSFSSCKKDKTETIVLEDSKAKVQQSVISIPSSTKAFFNLLTNAKVDSAASTINLSGMYASTLMPSSNTYKFGYIDVENSSVQNITLENLSKAKFNDTAKLEIDATSAGLAVGGPTWIIYDYPAGHKVYAVPNRYVVLYKGSSLSKNADEIIVFKAADVVASRGDATYTLDVKIFSK